MSEHLPDTVLFYSKRIPVKTETAVDKKQRSLKVIELVFVDGLSQAAAANQVKCSQNLVIKIVKIFVKTGSALVCKPKPGPEPMPID